MFTGPLTSVVNVSNYAKCVSLNNRQCMTQPTLVNLHPHEYNQGLHYCSFAVKLDRCIRRYNTFTDLYNKVCVPNKAEDLNRKVFNTVTGKNES